MIDIFVCGDITNNNSNCQFIEKPLIDIIKKSNYSICNFEGAIPVNISKNSKGIFQYENTIELLKDAGFDLILLANNHITDFGFEGLQKTIQEADKHNLKHIGAGFSIQQVYSPLIVKLSKIKFAFINLCEAHSGYYINEYQLFGYAWISYADITNIITSIRSKVDFLLIFIHAGLEHYKIPLREYRSLYKHLCDLGADCVICSHPHVEQGIEKYKDSYIFYSLGNFYFPEKTVAQNNNSNNSSFSIILHFTQNKISYTPVFHRIDNSKVKLLDTKDNMKRIEELNKNLIEPAYSFEVDRIYFEVYYNLCRKLYLESLMGTESKDNFSTTIKFIIKYLFFRNKYWAKTEHYRKKLLLHLIRNETYRYVVENVLNNYLDDNKN